MRGLCFDLDGTLVDSGHEGLKKIIKVAGKRDLPMTEEIEKRIRGMWGTEPLTLIRSIWPEEDIRAFFTAWEELDIAEPLAAFEGIREALATLAPNFDMSILTNRHFRTIMPQLEHNGIAKFFGLIVTPETTGKKKPDPLCMEPILERYLMLGINSEDVIFVGDTVEGDWKLAQALGLVFYAVTCGGVDSREKFLEAGVPEDHIFESVVHLALVLLKS